MSAGSGLPLMMTSNSATCGFNRSATGMRFFSSTNLRDAQGHAYFERSRIIQLIGVGDDAPARRVAEHFRRNAAQRIAAFDDARRKFWIVFALVLFRLEKLFK